MRHSQQACIPVRTQKPRRDGFTLSTLALAEWKLQTRLQETEIANMLETRAGRRRLRAMLHNHKIGLELYT